MQNDIALLERYSKTGDADAFAELAQRYARLVYSTCLHITANTQEAEDITQECFLELARRAGTIRSCLPGWLHRVAKNRALNALSKDATRKRYEQAAVGADDNRSEPGWAEIVPIVDEALDKLPDKLRGPIILHYLQGFTQAETAGYLGISQSTASRYLDRAIDCLREELKKSGVVLTAGALAVLLTKDATASVPASVMATIGKIAVSGIGTGGTATVATGGLVVAAKAFVGSGLGKAALVLTILAVAAVVGHVTYADRIPGPTSSKPASSGNKAAKADPSALQFCLLQDVVSRNNPKGIWQISLPQQVGEGYTFERLEYTGNNRSRVVEVLNSAKQPTEIMNRVVQPQRNSPFLTINDLLPNAQAHMSSDGKPALSTELTEHGAQVFADFTGKHVGECIGVFASGKLIIAPVVAEAMQISQFEITGFDSLAEAEALAKQINSNKPGQP